MIFVLFLLWRVVVEAGGDRTELWTERDQTPTVCLQTWVMWKVPVWGQEMHWAMVELLQSFSSTFYIFSVCVVLFLNVASKEASWRKHVFPAQTELKDVTYCKGWFLQVSEVLSLHVCCSFCSSCFKQFLGFESFCPIAQRHFPELFQLPCRLSHSPGNLPGSVTVGFICHSQTLYFHFRQSGKQIPGISY